MGQTVLIVLLAVGSVGLLINWLASDTQGAEKDGTGVPVYHNVYFKLKDDSPEATEKLVAACKKYLNKQPGVVFFSCGVVAEGLDREVNDRDWDVGLHVFFKDRASHDNYQTDADHKKFIEENKDNWAKVRVFDTDGK